MYYEYKGGIMFVQHGIVLRNTLFIILLDSKVKVKVKVKVTLRLTVSLSVSMSWCQAQI
jgi:hypothetical protein